MIKRCSWCGDDPLYQAYHDRVWGRPQYHSQALFKMLCLEGQQAGLSWITILRKQPGYEAAFFDFDAQKIAQMSEADLAAQLQNPDIVRNRLKIQSIFNNANAYLALQQEDDFSRFLWSFVDGTPQQNARRSMQEVPAETEASRAMSKALKKRGFSFVGPTICYAFMQATGMVNDHIVDCHFYNLC